MILKIKEFECEIDDEDIEIFNRHKWGVANKNGTPYIQSTINIDNKRKTIQLAREIMNASSSVLVDHIDGNTLNNKKYNLRFADKKTNAQNMKSNINTTSVHKGVSWDRFRNKWRSVIKVNGKQKMLGRFLIENDAAVAYNNAAIEFFGDYARLNLTF